VTTDIQSVYCACKLICNTFL